MENWHVINILTCGETKEDTHLKLIMLKDSDIDEIFSGLPSKSSTASITSDDEQYEAHGVSQEWVSPGVPKVKQEKSRKLIIADKTKKVDDTSEFDDS